MSWNTHGDVYRVLEHLTLNCGRREADMKAKRETLLRSERQLLQMGIAKSQIPDPMKKDISISP